MRKIKILFAVIAVVAMLSTVAFAGESTLVFDAATTDLVGDNVVLSVYADADVTIRKSASFSVQYDDTKWTYVGISNALDGMGATDYSAEDLPVVDVAFSKTSTTDIATGSKVCDITFTKKASDVYGTAFIVAPEEILGNNLKNSSGTKLNYSSTITVVAAGPTFVDKDYTNDKITPNCNDIEVAGQKYTNVALFDGSFSLASVELDEGESIKEAGVMFNGAKKATISVAGDGSVTYKVLFVGITPTEAAALNINTYYTLHEIAD